MIDRYQDATVQNIDRDHEALAISQKLCAVLGYGSQMSFACEDVSDQNQSGTSWQSFDVVFLAALVGLSTHAKTEILADLARKMRPGAVVVVRSARGLRSVLYPVR